MKPHQADHCVVDYRTQEFVCRHCLDRHRPDRPITALAYVRASMAFTDRHRDCPRPPVGQS